MAEFLTIEEILAAQDLQEETVDVPEWGGAVKVRSLTKAQQQHARQRSVSKDKVVDQEKLELSLIVAGMIEPRVTMEQARALCQKLAGVVDRILLRIIRLSDMNIDASVSAEAVDEAERSFRE